MPRLIVINAKVALDFHFDRAITIGRHIGSSLPLPDSEVSRRHAQISPREKSWVITDLGSSNGIYVNGKSVDQSPLKEGDEIITGETILLFDPPERSRPESLLSKHGLHIWKTFEEPDAFDPTHVATFSLMEMDEIVKGWLAARPLEDRLELPNLVRNEALLYAMSLDKSGSFDILAEGFVDTVRQRLGGDRIVLHQTKDGKRQMECVASWSNGPEERNMEIPREVLRICLESERAVCCRDIEVDYRFRHLVDSAQFRHMQSFLAIPVMPGHHYYGFVYAEAHRGGARYDFEALAEAYIYTSLFSKAVHWFEIESGVVDPEKTKRSAAV